MSAPTIHSEMKNKWIKFNVDSELVYRKLQQIFQHEILYYRSFLLEKEKKKQKFVCVFSSFFFIILVLVYFMITNSDSKKLLAGESTDLSASPIFSSGIGAEAKW